MRYQPINTGLLAFGMSGRLFHAPFLDTHSGFRFCSVTERHQKNANLLYPHVKSYNTVEDLIQDKKLELIIVNTPNNTHAEYANRVLLAGKHVLIEKPCATSVAEVKEIFENARKNHRYAMVFQNRRWDSDFLSVKNMIESGKLGKIIEVHFRFDRYRPEIESKIFKESPIPGSGLAYNLGSHLLDQVISLFGKPERIHKTVGSHRKGSKVDDYAFFHLVFHEHINVFIHVSLLVARPMTSFIIHGTEGSYIKNRTDVQESQLNIGISPMGESYGLETSGAEGELTLIDSQNNKTTEYIASPKGNYSGLFDAVYAQIRNNKPFPVKKKHILWQMKILELN